jgi:hypothetical protein
VKDDASRTVRVELSSPPDREFLVANIMVGTHEFAEVNQEEGIIRVEIYPRQDGEPWRFDYSSLVDAMTSARARLTDTRDFYP